MYRAEAGLPRLAPMPRHDIARPDRRPVPPPNAALALLARLPSRLADLPDEARDALGRAIDRGTARLVLADDGVAVVCRRSGP